MTNGEKALLLIEAAERLNNALADFSRVDECPARAALILAIRTVLAGTRAEEFTDDLIAKLTQHSVPLNSSDFATLTNLLSGDSEDDLFNVYAHYKNGQMVKC
ncbi:hypothetical protein J4P02_22440 [Pseudomonas sp. NFXW11]|uniref:hypothetical protein n=1 Tax=Pseudomonas sp. NFXW11 TaxID=2819531 RepID=UPI003CF57785